jgi:cytochrome c oxidase subunit 1
VLPGILTGIGGSLMFIGVITFFVVVGMTAFAGRPADVPADIPISGTLTSPARTGWEPALDRLGLWFAVAIVLIVIAYLPFFLTYQPNFVSPGFRLF